MCFGNKLNQKRPEHCITPFPTPNNFCGGFALNAVLVDLGSGTCPIEVICGYRTIRIKRLLKRIRSLRQANTCRTINQAALLCLCHRGYALHLKIM